MTVQEIICRIQGIRGSFVYDSPIVAHEEQVILFFDFIRYIAASECESMEVAKQKARLIVDAFGEG